MEIKIELDLPGIIANAVTAERIQPLVDKAISDAIKSAINDATGYSSEFRKAVEMQMKTALPHGLAVDDTMKFQQVLNQALARTVHGENAAAIQTALREAVKQAAPDVPEVLKLSELMELARQGFNKEDDGADFYAHLELDSHRGWGTLYLNRDSEPGYGYGDKKHGASYSLAFNGNGEVYSMKLGGLQLTPGALPTIISKFDSVLMGMYVGRTRLEIDLDEHDVKNAADYQHD